MLESFDSLIAWLAQHPEWLGWAIFLVACIECLALAGILVPGVAILFGLGVLAGGGVPLRKLAQEARKTPSPNSGWPMAAMALALGVRLSKPGVYSLNASACPPTAGAVAQAQKIVSKVALGLIWSAVVALVLIVVWSLWRG